MTEQSTHAELREALRQREHHSPLSGEQPGTIEPVYKPGTGIQEGKRVRLHDTLSLLYKRNSIDKPMYDAGRRFEEMFDAACLEPLRSASLDRVCGQSSGDLPSAVYGARRALGAKIDLLGGFTSPGASCVWAVLGEGKTVKRWAEECPFTMREEVAKGVLICALGSLVS